MTQLVRALGALLGFTALGVGAGAFLGREPLPPPEAIADLPVATPVERPPAPEPPTGEPAPERRWEVATEAGRRAILEVQPDDPWRGGRDASVTVVMQGDFESRRSRRASLELGRLHQAYGDRVLFVFQHVPADPACNPAADERRHRYACVAAEAAVCAADQGAFWAFHDLAFKNQHQLRPEDLRRYAALAGIDVARWETCVRDGAARARVADDGALAAALDVRGTPRIWVDGHLVSGSASAEDLARTVEVALGNGAAEAARAARALAADRPPVEPVPAELPEMRPVSHDGPSFRIDTFEAGLAGGVATVGRGQVPARGVSWYEARDACAAAGKRLCTEAEWVTACQGARAVDDDGDGELADDRIEGRTWPYGDLHDPRRCWDGKGDALRPLYTGELPGCVSADGVYDLTGNVEEWVGTTPEAAALLGGAWDTPRDHGSCYRRNDTFGAGYASRRTGFRCCAGPLPDDPGAAQGSTRAEAEADG